LPALDVVEPGVLDEVEAALVAAVERPAGRAVVQRCLGDWGPGLLEAVATERIDRPADLHEEALLAVAHAASRWSWCAEVTRRPPRGSPPARPRSCPAPRARRRRGSRSCPGACCRASA